MILYDDSQHDHTQFINYAQLRGNVYKHLFLD